MEQRPLRLGDIVDDYCPRERRITNHTIVVLVREGIRQTRCATCESEHAYKAGREPKRRRKDGVEVPDDKGFVDNTNGQLVQARRAEPDDTLDGTAGINADVHGVRAASAASDAAESNGNDGSDGATAPDGGAWAGHRVLIRATLPRTGAEPPTPRPIPEFTMHQRPHGRGGHGGFRGGQSWNGSGNEPNGNGFRQGRPGQGGGPGQGQGGSGSGRHRGKNRRPR